MLILNESPEKILSSTLLAKNKLENMKKQLEILIQKKVRIDNEIRILKKSIKEKQKSYSLRIKTSVNLEAYDPKTLEPTETTRKFIEREIPEAVPLLIQFDRLEEEIRDLLQELEELS